MRIEYCTTEWSCDRFEKLRGRIVFTWWWLDWQPLYGLWTTSSTSYLRPTHPAHWCACGSSKGSNFCILWNQRNLSSSGFPCHDLLDLLQLMPSVLPEERFISPAVRLVFAPKFILTSSLFSLCFFQFHMNRFAVIHHVFNAYFVWHLLIQMIKIILREINNFWWLTYLFE